MSASLDNGVDDDTKEDSPTPCSVLNFRKDPTARKLERSPGFYSELMRDFCRAMPQM